MPVLLFDGKCGFCVAQVDRLHRMSGRRFVPLSLHDPNVLDAFPGLTPETCMEEMKFIDRDGRVYSGVEAAVRSLAWNRPVIGRILYLYYLPGIRWMADRTYKQIARRRYRMGTSRCDDESCTRHTH